MQLPSLLASGKNALSPREAQGFSTFFSRVPAWNWLEFQ
jgi:hypothetical protein